MANWGGARATKIRAALTPLVASGTAICWRCKEPIRPDDPWDVGHLHGRDAGGDPWALTNVAPEHRSQCNRADGARITNLKRSRKARRLR